MKQLYPFALLFGLIIFNSCKKENQSPKEIDGYWQAERMDVYVNSDTFNLVTDGIEVNMIFYKCKFKKGKYSEATKIIKQNGSSESIFHDFRVSDSDPLIWELYTKEDNGDLDFYGWWQFDELENRYFKVSEFIDNELVSEMEFTKISAD